MTFMDDIIPFLYIGEAFDRIAAPRGSGPFPASLAAAEDVTFPYITALPVCQFHAGSDHAFDNLHMACFISAREHPFIECLVLDEFQHVLFSLFCAADDLNIKAAGDVAFQISTKLIHMSVVLRHLSGLHLPQLMQERTFRRVLAPFDRHDKRREDRAIDSFLCRHPVDTEEILLVG